MQVMFLRRVALKINSLARCRFFSSHDFSKAIAELNQEMESVFGEPPASTLAGSLDSQTVAQESLHVTNDVKPREAFSGLDQSIAQEPHRVTNDVKPKGMFSGLTHIGSKGEAQMIDVSSKEVTKRVAIASCKVILGQAVFDLVSANQMKKGDVLGVAKIAGICGAKQTSNLIPLCHNINLSHVHLDLTLSPRDFSIEIQGQVASTGKTGVEMEALTAVTIAGLTAYDMCKAASKDIVMTDVRLEHKRGGKSGDWSRKI